MLRMALRTANSRKTALKPPASQKLLNRAHNYRPQRSRAGLEAFFVGPDVTVKVSLKQLVKTSAFGMPRPVFGRRFRNDPCARILVRTETVLDRIRPGDDLLVLEGHGGQLTSRGLRAAIDLTAT